MRLRTGPVLIGCQIPSARWISSGMSAACARSRDPWTGGVAEAIAAAKAAGRS